MEKAVLILTQGNIQDALMKKKRNRIKNESVARKIIEEQQRLKADTVVIGGMKMSKANEFLFGSLPVSS